MGTFTAATFTHVWGCEDVRGLLTSINPPDGGVGGDPKAEEPNLGDEEPGGTGGVEPLWSFCPVSGSKPCAIVPWMNSGPRVYARVLCCYGAAQ